MIVNVQGDEPMIPATIIRQVADNLAQRQVGMATLAVPIHNAEEAFNPNAVKVVLDAEGYALYFAPPFLGIVIVLQKALKPLAITSCVILVFMATVQALSVVTSTGSQVR